MTHSPFRFQTVLETLNETEIHLRELADMLDHLQPKIAEFQNDFSRLRTHHDQFHQQAKMLESQCRQEYNALKHWFEYQQQCEQILSTISKQFEQSHPYHTLHQLSEFEENLTLNFNQLEQLSRLFGEARRVIEALDRSSQFQLTHTIEQYEARGRDLREHLEKKRAEAGNRASGSWFDERSNAFSATSRRNTEVDSRLRSSYEEMHEFHRDSGRHRERLDMYIQGETRPIESNCSHVLPGMALLTSLSS